MSDQSNSGTELVAGRRGFITVGGLNRLKTRYTLSTLSNGNVALLVNMAKNAGLPWDCVLSAEVFNDYKPDPEVYLGAAKLLGPKPGQVMMVAAHMDDLLAAKKLGLRTAGNATAGVWRGPKSGYCSGWRRRGRYRRFGLRGSGDSTRGLK